MATNRLVIFANNEIYHVYNRGVERRTLFPSTREYQRFVETLWFYRFANLPTRLSNYFSLPEAARQSFTTRLQRQKNMAVTLHAYCLMPNHFHLIVKQHIEHGISPFLSNLSNSFTKYFNAKHHRVGPLLQGTFKAVHIESEEQLLHVVRYVHLNPVSSFLIRLDELGAYAWSSHREYLGEVKEGICDTTLVQSYFPTRKTYTRFINDQAGYAKTLASIQRAAIDEEK